MSMFFINETAEEKLPIFREYAFDFQKNEFIFDKFGRHQVVEENEAIKVWIYKALKTERFAYLAYSFQFGIELAPFIGKVMTVKERESELGRVIKECLMVNPYIVSIDSIEFTYEKRQRILEVHIHLTSIYGGVEVNV